MPHYKRVFSPTGEPFDVPHERANELVLNNDWTHSRPVAAEPIEPAVTSVEPARRQNFGPQKLVRQQSDWPPQPAVADATDD